MAYAYQRASWLVPAGVAGGGMRRNMVGLVAIGLLLALIVVAGIIANQHDWDRRDAEFLAQCHEAGYDAAKCRFFLTATGRMNSTAATQMMIEAATPM
jgi:hypothetical protein